jgi:aspartate-semialdehyde dehydrogenase
VKDYAAGRELKHSVYPHQIAFNLIPKIGSPKDELPGYTSEEIKMVNETRKILEDKKIRVCATCVRVPVMNGHCEAINIEFDRPMNVDEARAILAKSPGVVVYDNLQADEYPMPIKVSGQDNVYVGRIRLDESVKNGLALFVSGDNIRKGAATNAIQIAEYLIAGGK